jgi:GTP cyclohydrolase I
MKTDHTLGLRVRDALIAAGVETPTIDCQLPADLKRSRLEKLFTEVLTTLGLDLRDDSLQDTPRRIAKMYVDEIFYGLDYTNFPKCTTIDNSMNYNSMLVERGITVQSNCEHHFVVISGKSVVAYIPGKKVIGLSKINRVVEFFAKRPQVQERLTEQVFHALTFLLETQDVAVLIDAEHFCVKSRGVKDVTSSTVTSKLGGAFLKQEVRAEFMSLASK